jgi:hypothetical protein
MGTLLEDTYITASCTSAKDSGQLLGREDRFL